jgi:chromatin structure-remodeling complex subunit RSC9
MSQVEVFNLYRDTFTPYSHEVPLVAGGEVVRQLAQIFPTTMSVKIEEPQRFVIRGLARKKEDRLVCCWDRDQCPALPFETRTELIEHVRQHVVERVEDELPCLWSTCPHPPYPKARLWTHLITHLQSQLPDPNSVALSNNGATLPPTIAVTQATNEPPATSLTALLCIRLLFHLSFSATGTAPRSDADRFGFPGLIDDDEEELTALPVEAEEEGERKGRQAFVGVRHLLERVQNKDLALMGWITEMLETTTYAVPGSMNH